MVEQCRELFSQIILLVVRYSTRLILYTSIITESHNNFVIVHNISSQYDVVLLFHCNVCNM